MITRVRRILMTRNINDKSMTPSIIKLPSFRMQYLWYKIPETSPNEIVFPLSYFNARKECMYSEIQEINIALLILLFVLRFELISKQYPFNMSFKKTRSNQRVLGTGFDRSTGAFPVTFLALLPERKRGARRMQERTKSIHRSSHQAVQLLWLPLANTGFICL